MTRLLIACACLVVALGITVPPAMAHHSAAGIDRTKSLVITGTVKEFRWTNPHSWIDIDVADKGVTKTWSVEMTSPAFLLRAGWKRSTLQAGDKVSVTLRPFRNGDPGGLFVSVTLADGRTLGERSAAPPPSEPARP